MSSHKCIWKASPSQVTNLVSFIVGALVAAALSAGLMLGGWLGGWWLWGVIAGICLLCLGPWIWKALNTKFFNYELTEDQLKLVSGVLGRNTEVMELYRIKDMTMERPFVYRLFGLSNIILTTSDRSDPTLTLTAVREGDESHEHDSETRGDASRSEASPGSRLRRGRRRHRCRLTNFKISEKRMSSRPRKRRAGGEMKEFVPTQQLDTQAARVGCRSEVTLEPLPRTTPQARPRHYLPHRSEDI